MKNNPANYAAGLLDERASALRTGDDALVADIDAQLAEARASLSEFDAAGLDEDQRAYVAEVRRRMAAAEQGDFSHGGAVSGPPSLHNAANYVSGLLDEHDSAVRAGRTDSVAEIEAELEKSAPLLERMDASGQDEAGVAHVAAVRRRHEAYKRGGKKSGVKAEVPPVKAPEPAPDKRTTKAASAPRTAATEG